jgi:hypothetical protein
MSRGLDSHWFADLKVCIAFCLSLSSVYDVGDPRHFNSGTPNEMWATMVKCWDLEPTSDRIVEDISNFPEILRKIIANHGCVLYSDSLHTGRRAISSDGSRVLKHKPRPSQRKATHRARVIHPDLQEARDMCLASVTLIICQLCAIFML